MLKRLLLLYLCCIAINCHAQTNLYVDSSVVASGAGTSWATAYKTLNEALNVANPANLTTKFIVNIAKGTYYPTGIQTAINRDSTFLIGRGGIKLFGGYPSGGGTRNAATNITTLSGNIGLAAINTDNSYHVMVIGGSGTGIVSTADSVIVDGFGFTGGNATGIGSVNTYSAISTGGGIFEYNMQAGLIIRNCNFYTNNAVYGAGIGTMNVGTGTSIMNNVFTNNTASNGAGICMTSSTTSSYLTIYGGNFTNNTATSLGGAIAAIVTNATTLISNSTFNSNHGGSGGAVYCGANNAGSIDSSTFINNNTTATPGSGGAVYFTSTSAYAGGISNSVFSGNAGGNGGAVYRSSGGSSTPYPNVINCSFTNNSAINGGALYNNSYTFARNCNFSNNSATGSGGAIYSAYALFVDSSSIVSNKAAVSGGGTYCVSGGDNFSYSTITNDSSALGGGIYAGNAGTYKFCNISANKANAGGGFYLATGNNILANDSISGNYAVNNGGGMFSYGNSGSIIYSLFSGNKAGNAGGAIYDTASSNTLFLYCTFSGDSAVKGNAFYNTTSSSPNITNAIIWDGAANGLFNISNSIPVITYSNVQGGYTGSNNLSSDPLFVSPLAAAAAPTVGGNYQLLSCSPAINSSNSTSYGYYDLARHYATFNSSIQDRGAYEYSASGINSVVLTSYNTCVGKTIQATIPATGGTWGVKNTSLATISNTGVITAVAAGIDTITYTVPAGVCPAAVGFAVLYINNYPVLPAISGSSTLCIGGSITLNDTAVTNGLWSHTNPTAISASSFGGNGYNWVLQGLAYGVDTVKFTFPTGLGAVCPTTVQKVVTVIPTPTLPLITGNTSICQNATSVLSNTVTGGYWTNLLTSISTVNNTSGLVTGVAPGTDTVFYTTYTNGCTSSTKVAVNILAAPVVAGITGPASICFHNLPTQYADVTPNGVWTSNDPTVGTITNSGVLTPVTRGNTSVIYTVTSANGCSSASSIYVNIGGSATGITQTGAVLKAQQPNGFYQWIDCGNGMAPISGETSQTFTATRNGSYAVILTTANGCKDTTACKTVTGVGINEATGDAIRIYPNPAQKSISISSGDIMLSEIAIRDLTGKLMLRKTLADKKYTLDVSSYPNSVYFIELYTQDGMRFTKTITIAH